MMTNRRLFLFGVIIFLLVLCIAHLVTKNRSLYFEIGEKGFRCVNDRCTYSVEVRNLDKSFRRGILNVKAYAEWGLAGGTRTQDLIASTTLKIELEPGSSKLITGSFNSVIKPTSVGAFVSDTE